MSGVPPIFEVNGRRYRAPVRPTIVVCLDGSDPSYLDDALAHGRVPTLRRWRSEGTWLTASAVVPTFTNPNNVSILTGAPPSVHGISGNYFYDSARREDVPMNDRAYLRAPTILDVLSRAGVSVAAITAKEKLRRLASPEGSQLPGIAFSVEVPGEIGRALVSRDPPSIYSEDASLYVLDAGIAIIERGLAQVVYVSTTDYIQHKHAPSTSEAREFYQRLDTRFERLGALGACVAVTADHGMNDKTRPDGSPRVIYLEDLLRDAIGPEIAHVTLPITDPYVVHHGALGSCAMVYLPPLVATRRRARRALSRGEGVESILDRDDAARRFGLPADRIGDLMVLAARDTVLGKTSTVHDLSQVCTGLRSHGGLHEMRVPLILNRPLAPFGSDRSESTHAPHHEGREWRASPGDDEPGEDGAAELRNFDVFDFALNRVA